MKKNRIIIAATAILISASVIGVSTALYASVEGDKVITIGGSAKADGSYTLTDSGSTSSSLRITPVSSATIKYKLGYNATSTYNQPYIPGNLEVKLLPTDSNIFSENLRSKINVTASIINYNNNSYYASSGIKALDLTAGDTGYSYKGDVVFSTNGTQEVKLEISKSNDCTLDDFISYVSNVQFNYEIKLTKESAAYKSWYIAGSFNNWEQESDPYRMVENIAATSKEYMCTLPNSYTLKDGDQFKAKYDGTGFWIPKDDNWKVSSTDKDNNPVGKNKIYLKNVVEHKTNETVDYYTGDFAFSN